MIAFLAGAAAGGALMLACLRGYLDRKIAEADYAGVRRMRRRCSAALVETGEEMRRLQRGAVTTPYPAHAPMRSAYRRGYRNAMLEAWSLLATARYLLVEHGESGQPLHPSEHVRLFVDNPATKP